MSRSHDSKAGSGTLSANGLEENTIAVIVVVVLALFSFLH